MARDLVVTAVDERERSEEDGESRGADRAADDPSLAPGRVQSRPARAVIEREEDRHGRSGGKNVGVELPADEREEDEHGRDPEREEERKRLPAANRRPRGDEGEGKEDAPRKEGEEARCQEVGEGPRVIEPAD